MTFLMLLTILMLFEYQAIKEHLKVKWAGTAGADELEDLNRAINEAKAKSDEGYGENPGNRIS